MREKKTIFEYANVILKKSDNGVLSNPKIKKVIFYLVAASIAGICLDTLLSTSMFLIPLIGLAVLWLLWGWYRGGTKV